MQEIEVCQRFKNSLAFGILHIVKVDHIVYSHRFQSEDHIREGYPQNLRECILFHLLIEFFSVQPHALPLLSSPCSTFPLNGLNFGNRNGHERVHVGFGIVCFLLDIAAINDVGDPTNCQRSFGYVGRINHFTNPLWGRFKHSCLVFIAQCPIERVNDHAWHLFALFHEVFKSFVSDSRCLLTLFAAREENQNISWALMQMNSDNSLCCLVHPLIMFDRMIFYLHRE